MIQAWIGNERPRQVRAPMTYADTAIQYRLILKAVSHLPLRQTQGFLSSLLRLLAVAPPVPQYSWGRRGKRGDRGPGTDARMWAITRSCPSGRPKSQAASTRSQAMAGTITISRTAPSPRGCPGGVLGSHPAAQQCRALPVGLEGAAQRNAHIA
jgi:hypothetical protein